MPRFCPPKSGACWRCQSPLPAVNFAGQWLQTRNLDFQQPDPKAFPDYDVELRDAMRTETEMFFQAIMTEDRSILDFLTANSFPERTPGQALRIPGCRDANFAASHWMERSAAGFSRRPAC